MRWRRARPLAVFACSSRDVLQKRFTTVALAGSELTVRKSGYQSLKPPDVADI